MVTHAKNQLQTTKTVTCTADTYRQTNKQTDRDSENRSTYRFFCHFFSWFINRWAVQYIENTKHRTGNFTPEYQISRENFEKQKNHDSLKLGCIWQKTDRHIELLLFDPYFGQFSTLSNNYMLYTIWKLRISIFWKCNEKHQFLIV